jgi:hypothetical protein
MGQFCPQPTPSPCPREQLEGTKGEPPGPRSVTSRACSLYTLLALTHTHRAPHSSLLHSPSPFSLFQCPFFSQFRHNPPFIRSPMAPQLYAINYDVECTHLSRLRVAAHHAGVQESMRRAVEGRRPRMAL